MQKTEDQIEPSDHLQTTMLSDSCISPLYSTIEPYSLYLVKSFCVRGIPIPDKDHRAR